ncbi:MAG: ABC transporter ATP-binding protein [SAR202 cluster bacterium]|nr:ABC transporter ATP-binding protein [SAR202 cluster bacterium]
MPQPNIKLKVSGLRASYTLVARPVPVLDGVDLEARRGQFVSVIGPSGSGKTTLLACVAGLASPDAGVIEIDGSSDTPRLGHIGFMPQKDLLLPWRSVLDNAILGLEVMGVPRADARRRALDLMPTFGLKGFERHYPSALSGGMRQRAALMRTLLVDQELVLLDEPFGALDAITRSQMQQWILDLWDTLGKTIVLVTHDVEEALLLSDRVYVLSPRPARVTLSLDVPLPRPRRYDIVTTPDFVSLKARLLNALHPPVAGQAAV